MLGLVAAIGVRNAFHAGLILSAFGFGIRHGIDWDHIAALTDLASSQREPRRSMLLATLYALGHGLVVFVLGLGAIVVSERLPTGVDEVMQRVVGATLILLGAYVFVALVRDGRDFRLRSRWMLVLSGVRRVSRRVRVGAQPDERVEIVHDHAHDHERDGERDDMHAHRHSPQMVTVGGRGPLPNGRHAHVHRHAARMPDDPFADYVPRTAFGIGMLHGIGAETPTQVLIFVAAAGVGGKVTGVLLLVCFLAGLLTSNTLIALASTFGFMRSGRSFASYVAVSVIVAVFSLVMGTMFVFGSSSALPALFGG